MKTQTLEIKNAQSTAEENQIKVRGDTRRVCQSRAKEGSLRRWGVRGEGDKDVERGGRDTTERERESSVGERQNDVK